MKLCKDCRHRKWTFSRSWVCRAGEHIPQEMVTDSITGKITVRYPGFSQDHPRCEYMRLENHAFVLVQCGPDGELWESK